MRRYVFPVFSVLWIAALAGFASIRERPPQLSPPDSNGRAAPAASRDTVEQVLSDPNRGQLFGSSQGIELAGVPEDLSSCAEPTGVDDNMRRMVRFLTAQESRVPGYPGHAATAEFLEREFDEIFGPENVHVEEYGVTVPYNLYTRCRLGGSGETFDKEVHPLWPFLVKLQSLPGGKVEGPVIYARKGEAESYDGRAVNGSIVLLDFDSRDAYLRARALGAQAVILLERGEITRPEARYKRSHIPFDAPLFYAEKAAAEALAREAERGGRITLESRGEWREARARNIWGEFPGEDSEVPEANDLEWTKPRWKDNTLIINAFYDSISVVPDRAPGATASSGIIGLVQTARRLRALHDQGRKNRFRLVFLANGAHYQNYEGITDFLYRHARGPTSAYRTDVPPADRLDPRLVISLETTGADPRILAATLGDAVVSGASFVVDVERQFRASWLQRVALTFQELARRTYGGPLSGRVLDGVNSAERSWLSYWPADGPGFDTDLVCFLGWPGIGFATPDDPMTLLDTPADTFENFHLANAAEQVRTLTSTLAAASRDRLFFERPNFQQRRDYGADVAGRAVWYDVKSNFSSPVGRIGEGGLAVYTRYFSYPAQRLGVLGEKIQKLSFSEPRGGDSQRGYEAKLNGQTGWRVHVSKLTLGLIEGLAAEQLQKLHLRVEYESASGSREVRALRGEGSEYFAELPADARRLIRLVLEEAPGRELPILGEAPLVDSSRTGECAGARFEIKIGLIRYATFRVWGRDLKPGDHVAAAVSCRGPQEMEAVLAYNPAVSARDGRATFEAPIDSGTLGVKEVVLRRGDKERILFANVAFEDVFHFRVIPQATNGPFAQVKIDGYRLDRDGMIDFATDQGQQGTESYPNIIRRLTGRTEEVLVPLFPCRPVSVLEILDSRYLSVLDVMTVLSPGDSQPVRWGQVVGMKRSRNEGYEPLGAVAFVDPDAPVKLMMGSDFFGVKYLLIDAPDSYVDEKYVSREGSKTVVRLPRDVEDLKTRGCPPDESVIFNPAYRVARDMWVLDESRARKLARYGVRNSRLADLHTQAYEELLKAKQALRERRYGEYLRAAHEAWGLEARAYPDVKGTAIDTVKGIIFYFALLLPFSFFMERLLFGFADFRKQIAGVSALFALAFLVLRWVHPAFKISDSPYVIFLAFVILVLGLLVMLTVILKFTAEVKKMKAEATGIVEADVGRLSATYSAIILGISNLRRRKARTTLTAATIILLTFAVLSFTSVNQQLEYWRIPSSTNCPYPGAMLRNRDYRIFQPSVARELKAAFDGKARIVRRNWRIFGFGYPQVGAYEITNPATGKRAYAGSFVGLEPEEAEVPVGFAPTDSKGEEHYRVGKVTDILLGGLRWFRPEERQSKVLILPDHLADSLGIAQDQIRAGSARVRLFDVEFQVIGIFDSTAADTMRFMDNERFTPIDMSVVSSELGYSFTNLDPTEVGGEEIEALSHLNSRIVPLMPFDTLEKYGGGGARLIAIYNFAQPGAYLDQIRDFMRRVSVTLFVGDGSRVQVYSSVGGASFSGLGKLFIPILIAAAIVLNTMLGAVYERSREIGIYSSVGLAPNHIGALFLAESFVFATVGAVFGYLLAQALAFGLSSAHWLSGTNLNYSSMSAVIATLIVMATVLASTAYPARKAAAMAVPDVSRRWSLAPPASDDWKFLFPFTVGGVDVAGLNVFLRDYFAAYEDNSVGDFFTRAVNLSARAEGAEAGAAYRLSMDVWLAPYDMSISQHMELESIPTGQHNVYEVQVTLRRLSGEVGSWIKMNHDFLNILRKRFLVWRTIPPGVKQRYAGRIAAGAEGAAPPMEGPHRG